MKRFLLLSLLVTLAFAPAAKAQPGAISEAEARDIAVEGYLYFYPIVTMELTRKQLINTPPTAGRSRRGGPPASRPAFERARGPAAPRQPSTPMAPARDFHGA
jgi:hypothetical protein